MCLFKERKFERTAIADYDDSHELRYTLNIANVVVKVSLLTWSFYLVSTCYN